MSLGVWENLKPGDTLGCPQALHVALFWRGGTVPYLQADQTDRMLLTVKWDRRLCDVSEAECVLDLAQASTECCEPLSKLMPGGHELHVYRDADLVWCGPVTHTSTEGSQITIQAQDMGLWLGRCWNTKVIQGLPDSPRDIMDVALGTIADNLLDSDYSCEPDWPNMLDSMVGYYTGVRWESTTRDSWYVPLLEILNDLSDQGFDWTVYRRSLLVKPGAGLTPDPTGNLWWTNAQALLTAEDLGGAVRVVRSIDQIATRAWATSQTTENSGMAVTAGVRCVDPSGEDNRWTRLFGRLDVGTKVSIPQDQQGQEQQLLTRYAQELLRGRTVWPVSFEVGDRAQLAPTAPVDIKRLIPGVRVDVLFTDRCVEVRQGLRLVYVGGEWSTGGEKVTVSLAPLMALPTDNP